MSLFIKHPLFFIDAQTQTLHWHYNVILFHHYILTELWWDNKTKDMNWWYVHIELNFIKIFTAWTSNFDLPITFWIIWTDDDAIIIYTITTPIYVTCICYGFRKLPLKIMILRDQNFSILPLLTLYIYTMSEFGAFNLDIFQ